MAHTAKQDKPLELNRYEFGFVFGIWQKWKECNRNRLQEPTVKALDKLLKEHWENAYR